MSALVSSVVQEYMCTKYGTVHDNAEQLYDFYSADLTMVQDVARNHAWFNYSLDQLDHIRCNPPMDIAQLDFRTSSLGFPRIDEAYVAHAGLPD